MKKLMTFLLITLLATSLMACSMVKKFTGQRDDSILPGTREEILPPEAQTARDPVVTGEKKAECKPEDPKCAHPVDQESPTIDQESSTAQ
jgi:hypothetical protein